MCLLDLLQRIYLVDPGLKLSGGKKVEKLMGVFFKLLSGRDVSHQRRSSDLDTFRCETTVYTVDQACLPLPLRVMARSALTAKSTEALAH